jgi:hypothetical protein
MKAQGGTPMVVAGNKARRNRVYRFFLGDIEMGSMVAEGVLRFLGCSRPLQRMMGEVEGEISAACVASD